LFRVILAVFVCLCWSFCYSQNAFMLMLVGHKYKHSVLASSPCVFLACYNFFTTLKIVFGSCRFVVVFLAVLFRSCCRFFVTVYFVCFAV
jgi:hypothetical protein